MGRDKALCPSRCICTTIHCLLYLQLFDVRFAYSRFPYACLVLAFTPEICAPISGYKTLSAYFFEKSVLAEMQVRLLSVERDKHLISHFEFWPKILQVT